jgi:hypothetical protein
MQKTALSLDRDLAERARKALGDNPTITETIHEGLRRIVRDAARTRLAAHIAAFDDEQRAAIADARNNW